MKTLYNSFTGTLRLMAGLDHKTWVSCWGQLMYGSGESRDQGF